MTIGNRISELRKAKGYTQEYIAEQLGVSRQAVSKWEQDLSSPSTDNLIALSELLESSVEYIAVGRDDRAESAAQAQEQKEKRIERHNFYITGAAFTLLIGGALTVVVPYIGILVLAASVVFFILAVHLEDRD